MKVDLEEVVYKPTSYEVVSQELKPQKRIKPDTFYLYFSAITVNLPIFALGCIVVWTSPVLPKLKMADPEINPLGEPITTIQTSLIAGLPMAASLLGTLSLGRICDVVGRKKAMHYMIIGLALANILLAFGRHIYVYYVARSAFMFFIGIGGVCVPVYLSEISEDHNRGKYGCLMGTVLPLGSLYSFVLGPVTTVRDFTLLCTVPLILAFIAFFFIPESPVYLAMKKDKKGAINVLTKLRNKRIEDIVVDYETIEQSLKAEAESRKAAWSALFKSRIHRKALVIGLGVNFVQQLSGASVIMTFLAPIFNDAGTQLSGNSVAIIVGIVKVCCLVVTLIVVEKLGKRPLMLASTTLATIPIFLLGLFFYWKSINASFIENIRFLPIVCIIVYIIAYSLGLGSIPITIIGDIFPGDVKSAASTLTIFLIGGCSGIFTTAYPIIAEYFGIHTYLWFFSTSSLLCIIFIYFKLPETRGRNYLEIRKILEG